MHDRQKLGDQMTWRRIRLELTPSCGCGSEEEEIKSESGGSGIRGEETGSWREVVISSSYDKMSEKWNER